MAGANGDGAVDGTRPANASEVSAQEERMPDGCPAMEAKLYVILGSHACRTGMLLLEHKGIEYPELERKLLDSLPAMLDRLLPEPAPA